MDFRRLWRNFFWFALSFAVVVVPSFAFADEYPVQTWYQPAGHPENVSPDLDATGTKACSYDIYGPYSDWRFSLTLSKTPPSPWSYGSTTGVHCYKSVGWVNAAQMTKVAKCPYGGTVSGSLCINAPACTAPQVRDALSGECKAPPCEAGTVGEGTFDIAYRSNTNTKDGSSLIGDPRIPTTACEGNCQLSVGSYSGGCWLKTEVGPPYVVACAFETTTTGQSCTAADSSGSAPMPPIPCPENTAEGSVNGVSGCYPTTTTEKETTKTDNPDSTTTEQTTETTCIGDQCSTKTTTKTCDQAGNCTESTTETPASGPVNEPTAEEKEIEEKLCETDPECAAGKFTKAEKGTFDMAAANAEKVAAEQRVRDKIAEIRAEAAGMWGGVSGGAGALPVLASFTVLGKQTTWELKPEWMDWLPTVVMLMAAILAAFILFRD